MELLVAPVEHITFDIEVATYKTAQARLAMISHP